MHGVALECSTGTAALADALIQRTGWDVHLCHPGYVRRLRQNPDKTDLSDAHLLADLVRVGYLPRVWLAPPAIRDLRTVVRYRQQVVDSLRNTKLRIRALLREHRVPDVPQYLWTGCGRVWLRNLKTLPVLAGWVLESQLAELDSVLARLARHRAAAGGRQPGWADSGAIGPSRHRAGDGLRAARRDRAFSTFPHGQAALAVLRREPVQRLLGRPPGRCRSDPRL